MSNGPAKNKEVSNRAAKIKEVSNRAGKTHPMRSNPMGEASDSAKKPETSGSYQMSQCEPKPLSASGYQMPQSTTERIVDF